MQKTFSYLTTEFDKKYMHTVVKLGQSKRKVMKVVKGCFKI